MKQVVFIFVVLVLANAAVLNREQREKLLVYHLECVEDSHVDQFKIGEALLGKFSDDPKLKSHILCFSKKLGFINEDGKIDTEVMRAKLTLLAGNKGNDKVNEVVEKCGKDMETPEDTALELLKCLFEVQQEGNN